MKSLSHLTINLVLTVTVLLGSLAYGQDKPITIKISGARQAQTEIYKASEAAGFGLGAQMNFRLWKGLEIQLKVNYDYLALSQNDVLDEWDWDYWEKTYIDFLPGTNAQTVNKSLTYTSADSIYSADFDPTQRLKELRLMSGLEYNFPLSKRIKLFLGIDAGVSLFFRELQMNEHWTKRFKIDSLSTTKFDYEFQYDLLHFAPTKKGSKLFAAPRLGLRFILNPSLDFDLAAHYIHYLDWNEFAGIKLTHGHEWFPLKSKFLVSFGLVFKY